METPDPGAYGDTMSTMARPVLDGFDPLSQAYFDNPFPIWAQARSTCPVFWYGPMKAWFVSRYDDVERILVDFETFSSENCIEMSQPPEHIQPRIHPKLWREPFIQLDPPRHTSARKAVNKGFTRTRIAEQEDAIRALSHQLVDAFVDDGRCDLVTQFSFPLTITTIARLLGLPAADIMRLKQWATDAASQFGPTGYTLPPSPDRDERWTGIADAQDYFTAYVAARAETPQDDLISAMLQATDRDGNPIASPDEMVTHLYELVAAGTDTTAGLITNMVRLFAENPEQRAAVLEDPQLWTNAVEEGLRYIGSSWGTFRRTTRDVELSGVPIPADSVLFHCNLSAGHDEARFPDPERFDVGRANAEDHLAFGKGRHFCLGAPLARLEARVGLQTLYERLPDLVVPEQPRTYHRSVGVPLLEHLEVTWPPAAG
jgi:cytochrome P450